MANGICTVEICTKPIKNQMRGLCNTHAERLRLTGDLRADEPIALRWPPGTSRLERFVARVEKTETCWLWTGYRNSLGYGQFGTNEPAHRVSYELFVGPIPHALVVDHLCRNPPCVNPAHLEPVTNGENLRRGVNPWGVNAQKTHCVHGHEFTPENTYHRPDKPNSRACRTCLRERARARYARRRAA